MSLRNVPMNTWALSDTFTELRVIPAAKQAIEALAPDMRVKEGDAHSGHLKPKRTRITARIGAQATGCFSAFHTGSQGLGFLPLASLVFMPALSRLRPMGIPRAFTSIATMAITRPTAADEPNIGSSTAKPRKPMVGEPLISADTAASPVVSL